MTSHQVEKLLFRLYSHLNDLIEGKEVGFDFNYFWSVTDQDNIPFYGDKKQAKRIFYLYYEKRMTANEIIDTLNLDCSQSTIIRIVTLLELAVLKRGKEIKKVRTYSLQEISAFYSEHKASMNRDHRDSYDCYFKKGETSGKLSVVGSLNLSPVIMLDILKANNEICFDIKYSTKKEVIEIIRKYRGELSAKTENTLSKLYGVTSRDLMSGREQMKVLNFLSELNVKNKVLSLKMIA